MNSYEEDKRDREFLVHIIVVISKYAKDNKLSVDDTIAAVAARLLDLLEIATFEHMKIDDK